MLNMLANFVRYEIFLNSINALQIKHTSVNMSLHGSFKHYENIQIS